MFYQFNHLGSPDYLKAEFGEDFNFPLHLHQCYEFVTVTSGEMLLTVDNKEYLLKEGEGLLIFPNQIHSFKSQKSKHFLIIFSPSLVQAFNGALIGKIPKSNKFIPNKHLVELAKGISTAFNISEKKGILYLLCSEFNKIAQYEQIRIKDQKPLFKMFLYVENNFAEDIKLSSLAESIGYDYSYLSRLFKKMVGMSFNTYLNHYRLSLACYLIENFDNSILSCATMSGYSSLRNFNRNFKLHFGVTPKEYRAKNNSITQNKRLKKGG